MHKPIWNRKMSRWLDLLISFCGQVFTLALQGSMLTSAVDIQHTGNEKRLSSAPYLCLLVNCVVWTTYATLQGYIALLIPNVIGVFIGFYCTFLYYQFSRYTIPPSNLALSSAVVMLVIVLGAAGSVGAVGLFAVIMSSIVYASPLSTIATVIQQKSTASMPFHTSMLVWLSAAFWALYGGLVTHDIAVLIPSLAGLIMASMQLFLYVLYGFPPQEISNPPTVVDRRGHQAIASTSTAIASATKPTTNIPYKPVRLEPKEDDPAYQELKSYQQYV